jgi:cell wall-associated NlpC family hydrolase
MPSQRAAFLVYVIDSLDSPYLWGAKGEFVQLPEARVQAFDCSGLVTWSYLRAGGPDWRATHNTDKLLLECQPVRTEEAAPGDLAFYGTLREGRPDPSHVMVHVGAGVVVGAAGGDFTTTTLEAAAKRGARVLARTSLTYRRDFLGLWRLPFSQ